MKKAKVFARTGAATLMATGAVLAVLPAVPAEAYHAKNTAWDWDVSVANSGATASAHDHVWLDGWPIVPGGCSNAWFTGKSQVNSPQATSVKLGDKFWGNQFGPGNVQVGWPPSAVLNDPFDPGAWTDTFAGSKGAHVYNNLNMNLPNGTTFTGVNHEIAASGDYGIFGVLLIGRSNVGEAVC